MTHSDTPQSPCLFISTLNSPHIHSFSHHFRCSVHTLCYSSKLTFCPKHFKTCKDKSESKSNKDLTSGTRHFYNIWPNTEHLKRLSYKINLKIRYHPSSILENIVIALYLDCADWVTSAGCHMLAIAELRPSWEHSASVTRSWEINNFIFIFENHFFAVFNLCTWTRGKRKSCK